MVFLCEWQCVTVRTGLLARKCSAFRIFSVAQVRTCPRRTWRCCVSKPRCTRPVTAPSMTKHLAECLPTMNRVDTSIFHRIRDLAVNGTCVCAKLDFMLPRHHFHLRSFMPLRLQIQGLHGGLSAGDICKRNYTPRIVKQLQLVQVIYSTW